MGYIAAICVAILVFLGFLFHSMWKWTADMYDPSVPCERWAGISAKDIPARCVKYFTEEASPSSR